MEGIRDSLIWKEVEAITNGGPKDVHFTFGAELYAGDEKLLVHRVNYININGNYHESVQDEVIASFKLEPSVYQLKVLPNYNNLTVHLTRTPVYEDGRILAGPEVTLDKLRAYLVHPVDMIANHQMELTAEGLDLTGFKDIAFQLVDPFANRIRLYMCATNYRSETPAEVLKMAIARAIMATRIDGQTIEPRIDMIDPDNTNKRTAFAIPHGKTLTDLPHYLQDRQGGIYNAGIRMYCQRRGFYVWPKYYLGDRVGQRKQLTIFNLPANQLPGAERTYRETDYQVMLISTGKNTQLDITQNVELNEGNGVRFTNASAILDGMVVGGGNKAVMRRGFANSEFIDGETGRDENYAPMGRNRITANPYAEVSRLASRKGTVTTVVWQNADPYLLEPGMATKVIGLEEGRLVARMGSLINAEYHMGAKVDNIKNNQLSISAGLSVFLSKQSEVVG